MIEMQIIYTPEPSESTQIIIQYWLYVFFIKF